MSYGRPGRRDNTFLCLPAHPQVQQDSGGGRGCRSSGIPGHWDSPTGKVLQKTSSGLNVTSAEPSEAQRGVTLHGDAAQGL